MTAAAHQPAQPLANHQLSRRWPHAVASALAALAILAAALAITASPAQAATPGCNYVMSMTMGTDITETLPAYASGDYRTWRCVTRYGDGFNQMNYAVQNLQDTMNLCYRKEIGDRWPLSTDGSFGHSTRLALIRVQQALRISADGEYGPQTAAAMTHWTTAYTPYGLFHTCNRIPGQ